MNLKIKERLKSQYLKSVSVLMTGTIISQIMAFFVSMYMTRLFSEEAIGEYTLFITAVSMFGAVICGRYDMSIVPEKSIEGIYSLVKLSLIVTSILSIVVGIGYTIYISASEKIEISFFPFLSWTILLLFLTGLNHIGSAYINKYKEYKLLSKIRIIQEAGRDVVLVGTGLLKLGALGLIVSQIVSLILCLRTQFKRLSGHMGDVFHTPWQQVKKYAAIHKNQPLYSLPSQFINSFSYSILTLFVGNLFGLQMLAFYSVSYRILGIPITLLSVNISKVFFERAASCYNKGQNFTSIYLKSALLLFILALPLMIILFLFSPTLFGLLYGKGWEISGEMVVPLIPMFYIKLIVGALTPTMIIVNKQRLDMILQLLFVFCVIFVYCISEGSQDIFFFLKCITVGFSAIYLLYFFIMLRYTRTSQTNSSL